MERPWPELYVHAVDFSGDGCAGYKTPGDAMSGDGAQRIAVYVLKEIKTLRKRVEEVRGK